MFATFVKKRKESFLILLLIVITASCSPLEAQPAQTSESEGQFDFICQLRDTTGIRCLTRNEIINSIQDLDDRIQVIGLLDFYLSVLALDNSDNVLLRCGSGGLWVTSELPGDMTTIDQAESFSDDFKNRCADVERQILNWELGINVPGDGTYYNQQVQEAINKMDKSVASCYDAGGGMMPYQAAAGGLALLGQIGIDIGAGVAANLVTDIIKSSLVNDTNSPTDSTLGQWIRRDNPSFSFDAGGGRTGSKATYSMTRTNEYEVKQNGRTILKITQRTVVHVTEVTITDPNGLNPETTKTIDTTTTTTITDPNTGNQTTITGGSVTTVDKDGKVQKHEKPCSVNGTPVSQQSQGDGQYPQPDCIETNCSSTCAERRATWERFKSDCDHVNWQTYECRAFVAGTLGCPDPGLIMPAPDGDYRCGYFVDEGLISEAREAFCREKQGIMSPIPDGDGSEMTCTIEFVKHDGKLPDVCNDPRALPGEDQCLMVIPIPSFEPGPIPTPPK